MRTLLLMIAAILIMAGSCKSGSSPGKQADVQINPERVVLFEVSINGMTCTGCENTVKSAISELPGVAEVSASFAEGKAFVKADSSITNGDQISLAVNGKGYKVTAFKIATSENK